jgi:DNA polymerase-3 subunit epsilon
MLRYARKMIILVRTQDKNGYATIAVKEVEKIDIAEAEKILGTFKSMKQMQEHLYMLAKNFKLCTKLLGLDKARKRCFYYDLGICEGACFNKELNIKYNVRFEEAFYKYKIKQWKFKGPIIIKEVGVHEEAFVVDKWCLMGSAKNEDEFKNLSKEYLFDLDTYKILTKFILSPTRKLSITTL